MVSNPYNNVRILYDIYIYFPKKDYWPYVRIPYTFKYENWENNDIQFINKILI